MTFPILTIIALACYLASSVCNGAVLFLNAPAAPVGIAPLPAALPLARYGRPLLLLGIVVHFFAIGMWCVSTHSSPFASETGTLTILAWTIAIATAILDYRGRLPAVSSIALLFACLALCGGVLQAHEPIAATPVLRSQIITLHVLAIVAGFGLFAVAFGCAALYLLQNRALREKPAQGLFRKLPPLATLDATAYRSVAFALPLLTLGLAIGFEQAFTGTVTHSIGTWIADPRIVLSLVVWFNYVLYLGARLLLGWRGVRLQYILLVGMLIAFAVYLVPTSTHRFS
jgi:ABC-type transport system involved in cytochrome c biogenesis permease subunit